MISAAHRLLHTAIHLKPIQIYGRALFLLRRPQLLPIGEIKRRSESGSWSKPARKPRSLLGPQRFRFLNREAELTSAADWNNSEADKLWLYNLHYFDFLSAPQSGEQSVWRKNIVERWIRENPPNKGNGWEPYPTSLRIVNWVKWALGGNEAGERWLESLATQAHWLELRLEWHLLGNHLLANAKALLFAGAFFDGPHANRWLERGLSIFSDQLSEQVLHDGGHFELSPMYHSIVLEDVLDLINLGATFPNVIPDRFLAQLTVTADRMRTWLCVMTHPDGLISFFNDAAFGIAPDPRTIADYSARLGLHSVSNPSSSVTHLEQSGYIRLENEDAVTLLDVGAIGPDHLPGHAHADTLSFEMSLGINRVIVNGGTSVYGNGRERQRQRSTAAHNTVEIDGKNSSDVWAGFRVGRRARVFDLAITHTGSICKVECAHDGYKRLPGKPVHRRRWKFSEGQLSVSDKISGKYRQATRRFHLAPGVQRYPRTSASSDCGELLVMEKLMRYTSLQGVRLEPYGWHPEFGATIESRCLVSEMTSPESTTCFTW